MVKPQDTTHAAKRSNELQTQKAYTKPRLQIYGDLADITKAVKGKRGKDGSGHPNKHFTS